MDAGFLAKFKTEVPVLVAIETGPRQVIGSLESLTVEHARDFSLLERICDWHNRSRQYYSDPAEWTPQSTAEWLTHTVFPSNNRLLFLVRNEWGDRIGLCGLSRIGSEQAEIYDIIRGEPGGHALLLPYAEIAMLRLCFEGMGLYTVVGAIHEENAAARRLGRFVGFEEYGSRIGQTTQVLLRVTRGRLAEQHPALTGVPEMRFATAPTASL